VGLVGERDAASVDCDAAVAEQLRLRARLRRAGSSQEPGAVESLQRAGDRCPFYAFNESTTHDHTTDHHNADPAYTCHAHSIDKR